MIIIPKRLIVDYRGETFTRRTDRQYSHIVVGKNRDERLTAFAWCGRLDLAKKQVALAENSGLTEVQIVPIPEQ